LFPYIPTELFLLGILVLAQSLLNPLGSE